MDDEPVLQGLRAALAPDILSVCTGMLMRGAAGLLRARGPTTHWNSFHLLPYCGATAENVRLVANANLVHCRRAWGRTCRIQLEI